MNEKANHCDTMNHKNMGCPILVWDFEQRAQATSVGCYITSIHIIHINKCASIVKTHQIKHGGGRYGDFWI